MSIVGPIKIIQSITDFLEAFDENHLELFHVVLELIIRHPFNVVSLNWDFLFVRRDAVTKDVFVQIDPLTARSGIFDLI